MSSLVGVKNGEKDAHGWKIAAYYNVDVDPILNVPEPNKRSKIADVRALGTTCPLLRLSYRYGDSGRMVGYSELIVGPRSLVLVSRVTSNLGIWTNLSGNRVNRELRVIPCASRLKGCPFSMIVGGHALFLPSGILPL
jgi:hypothetical protein